MKKVFLFEPDTGIYDIISYVLQNDGCVVHPLPDPESTSFKEAIQQADPDLVIIDCFINEAKPSSWCKTIRDIVNEVPIIATSCLSNIKQRYQTMGFSGYLEKPFDIRSLEHIVKRSLTSPAYP